MTPDGMLALHTLRAGGPGGLPLVLLHGFPLDHRMWADVVPLLTGDPTVLAPDLPGFGVSPRGEDVAQALAGPGTTQEPSIDLMADAVAESLRAAGVERAVVAGLSMGGYVALALVERHRELVAGLALVDTKAVADTDEAREQRLRVARAVLDEPGTTAVAPMATTLLGRTSRATRPELVDRLAGWIADQGAVGVAGAQRAMAARPDRTSVLRHLSVPAVVVVGVEDQVTPPALAADMAEEITDGELVEVPGSGHMTTIENPQPVAAALTALLSRVS